MKNFLLLLLSIVLLSHCSLNLGTSGGSGLPFPNDAVPAGTLIAQGTFTGQNSQTVTGTAGIYYTGSSYIVRLGSFSSPSVTGLQVQVYTNISATPACTISLYYYSGNKNYTCAGASGIFSTVNIYNIANQQVYGVAQLNIVGN